MTTSIIAWYFLHWYCIMTHNWQTAQKRKKTNKFNKLLSPLETLNISASFFNLSSKFVQTSVSSVNKLLNAQNFSGNVLLFDIYKWSHSDVIITKLTHGTQNWIPYKHILWIFPILRISVMAPFYKLIYGMTLVSCLWLYICSTLNP